MPDGVKTISGSLVLDLRIWWRHVHTLYWYLRIRLQIYILSITVVNFTFRIVQSTKTVFMTKTHQTMNNLDFAAGEKRV